MDKFSLKQNLVGFVALLVLTLVCVGPVRADDDSDFVVVYPGQWTEREKPLAEKFLADNKAIKERGPVDVEALIKGALPEGTPGIGPVVEATPEMVAYQNGKYDPDNKLYTDSDYARALGYQDLLVYPTIAAHDDTYLAPFPGAARDKLLVSQLNHEVISYRPIYPGDKLYVVTNERVVTDVTPESGSTYRHLAMTTWGSIYNQHGEKVNDVVFRVMESLRQYKDGKAPTASGAGGGMAFWIGPEWKKRPQHMYTEQDWRTIKNLWQQEKQRGDKPLYWEDVKVGDMPTWTVDGPIVASVSPTPYWGTGTGGSRTLKKEILSNSKDLVLNRDGIYVLKNRDDYIPPVPGASTREAGAQANADLEAGQIDTREIHKQVADERAVLINFLARDLAIRHLNNWMGDHGWLQSIRWGIMSKESMAGVGLQVPMHPTAENFLEKAPSLAGKQVNAHGLTTDLAIIKSYVYDKSYQDGEGMVKLALWAESIDGYIWWAGGATVKLPSKSK